MQTPSFLLRLMLRKPLGKSVRLTPEERESIILRDLMAGFVLDGSYHGVFLHVPNEGKRTKVVGAILKAMGLVPGASDFIFAWAGGTFLPS